MKSILLYLLITNFYTKFALSAGKNKIYSESCYEEYEEVKINILKPDIFDDNLNLGIVKVKQGTVEYDRLNKRYFDKLEISHFDHFVSSKFQNSGILHKLSPELAKLLDDKSWKTRQFSPEGIQLRNEWNLGTGEKKT